MPVSSVDSSSSAAGVVAYGNGAAARKVKQSLGSDDFMKLLAVQFQTQDPMKPMEDSAFIAQMAQFTSLEQSTSLVKEMGQLRSDQQNLSASSLLGRTVTVTGADGLPVTGQVSAVENTANGPQLVVGSAKYALSSVSRVEYTPPTYLPPADLPPAA